LALATVAVTGCARKTPHGRASLKKEVGRIVKAAAPNAVVQLVGGQFRVEDSSGQVVMVAHIRNANAVLQPSDPSKGPVTVYQAHWTLYKDGQPSLWMQAPVATWQGGLLTAPRGAHSGSVDGKITLQGKTATWAAQTNLLTVSTVDCQMRDPGQPALKAQGPVATWQDGLLVMPSGATARAADRSASMRSDHLRWRARTHAMEATGRVRMSRDRLTGAAERLTGDTALRRFRLSGGRPRVTIFNQPAPLVVAALEGAGRPSRIPRNMTIRKPAVAHLVAFAGSLTAMTLFQSPAAPAARALYRLPSGVVVEADGIKGDPTGVHATGDVVLTSPQGDLRADRVDVALGSQKPTPGATHSAVREALATGHVRLTSQPKPDEKMEATGAAGTYWPTEQKATLTGGVTVTMASPQLEEPAVLTGARADMDLAKRSATVVRTAAEPVRLKLRPKANTASGAASTATTGPLQLEADRMLVENAVNRVTATGSPVLTADQGTVHADKIWFDIDPKARDVQTVHAVGEVRIDSQDPQRGTFHGTAREAVMNRAENTVVLAGDVHGTQIQPGAPEPQQLQGEKLTYNLKTGAWEMLSSDETRAQARFTPKPKLGARQKEK
jgi:lipopolysaccharide transport protein LptA